MDMDNRDRGRPYIFPPIPQSCPFTICRLSHEHNGSSEDGHAARSGWWLIREHDEYGEYPHIYAKICRITMTTNQSQSRQAAVRDGSAPVGSVGSSRSKKGNKPEPETLTGDGGEGNRHSYSEVIVLSDTGCGTEVSNDPGSHDHSHGSCLTAPAATTADDNTAERGHRRRQPAVWNLGTFLEYTLNPGGRIPYLVITTHCHYDHIMGIWKLPPPPRRYLLRQPSEPSQLLQEQSESYKNAVLERRDGGKDSMALASFDQKHRALPQPTTTTMTTILASSRAKHSVTPYSNLQRYSLCEKLGLKAPRYAVGIWAQDMQRVVYTPPPPSPSADSGGGRDEDDDAEDGAVNISTGITILHTPGHTPDSLAWYDEATRTLCVGDSFYLKQTGTTRSAAWGPESPMPIMFNMDSLLATWWESAKKILDFVRQKNNVGSCEDDEEDGWVLVNTKSPFDSYASTKASSRPARVRLCAAHTTALVDAEAAICAAMSFMRRILRDEVPCKRVSDARRRGEERWLWDDDLEPNKHDRDGLGHHDEEDAGGSGRRQGKKGKVDRDEEGIDVKGPNCNIETFGEYAYSVLAPLGVIEKGRRRIPKDEWGLAETKEAET
ncbi:hypothetical protein ABEF93_004713 [Exophiala dermatitidis]